MNADFFIDFNGNWFHNGAPIERAALVKLFAERALKVDEAGDYWLSTPFEKYPVAVEDVPFLIVSIQEDSAGFAAVTNLGETITLPAEKPFEMRFNAKENMELPYAHVRNGLYARLSRAAYYDVIERFGTALFS